jgi:hypothetical protein
VSSVLFPLAAGFKGRGNERPFLPRFGFLTKTDTLLTILIVVLLWISTAFLIVPVLTGSEVAEWFGLGVSAGAFAWAVGYGWLAARRALRVAVSD